MGRFSSSSGQSAGSSFEVLASFLVQTLFPARGVRDQDMPARLSFCVSRGHCLLAYSKELFLHVSGIVDRKVRNHCGQDLMTSRLIRISLPVRAVVGHAFSSSR